VLTVCTRPALPVCTVVTTSSPLALQREYEAG
jgi:hypothetical protein